MELGAVNADSI